MPLPTQILAHALLLACLLAASPSDANPVNIWHISIDEGPAPPPDQGPPLSAHALRDPSKLRYELIGIAGAYIFCVLLSTFLIVCVGRRLRRRTRAVRWSITMDMVKNMPRVQQSPPIASPPLGMGSPTPPISPRFPARLTSWMSAGKGHRHHASQTSVSTVDEKVVEHDKMKSMDEMAKLYAAVLQHDEEKAQSRMSSRPQPAPQFPQHSPTLYQPPELQYLRNDFPFVQPSSQSLATTAMEEDPHTAVASRASSRKTKASPLSFLSTGHTRADSVNSTKSRPSRISVRGLPISHPVESPALRDVATFVDEVPLSPRIYTPGPPPPTPGQKSAAALAREVERDSIQRAYAPPALSFRSHAATNSTGSLPFRQAYPESMQSAPATKTTFLERREQALHPAPKTGVPSAPYSPYMPFTPVTPITPRRLVTKDEMKRKKKMRQDAVLTPDDVVPSEQEMWGEI